MEEVRLPLHRLPIMTPKSFWFFISFSVLAFASVSATECDPVDCDGQLSCDEECACDALTGIRQRQGQLSQWLDLADWGGWISGGLTLNGDGNRSGNGNAPYGYNNVSDGAVLNQLWFYGERELDEDRELDWGFRVDYLFGTDGPDNQAFADESWDFGWNSARDYGSAIPQVYGDFKFHDLTVRVGYFLTPIGWENVPTNQNFFYSHSFTFYYSEPNTHSGFLATYQLNDRWSVQAGWTLGMDGSFANHLDASTFLGGVSCAFNDQTTLTWSMLAGDFGDGTGRRGVSSNQGDIYIHSILLEHDFSEQVSYGFHHDLGVNSVDSSGTATWYAIVQYLTCEVNETLTVGTRLEWFRDETGARIGASGDYYEATLGLNWRRCERMTLRPEVRWDWSGGAGNPFDNGTEDNFFTYAINALYEF